MDWIELLGVSVGLGMDAFAVAVGASVVLGAVTARQTFRLSFHFGLFQALMPILGWAAARSFAAALAAWSHWVAFALLALIGGRALLVGIRGGDEPLGAGDPSRGGRMVTLSVAVSIDALAAGVSFAMLGIVVWIPAAVIGVITAAMTLVGLALGVRVGAALGHRAAILGGLILVGIGVKILAQGSPYELAAARQRGRPRHPRGPGARRRGATRRPRRSPTPPPGCPPRGPRGRPAHKVPASGRAAAGQRRPA